MYDSDDIGSGAVIFMVILIFSILFLSISGCSDMVSKSSVDYHLQKQGLFIDLNQPSNSEIYDMYKYGDNAITVATQVKNEYNRRFTARIDSIRAKRDERLALEGKLKPKTAQELGKAIKEQQAKTVTDTVKAKIDTVYIYI